MGTGSPEITETIITQVLGEKSEAEKWGVPQWKWVMAGNCRRSLLTTEHSFIGLRR